MNKSIVVNVEINSSLEKVWNLYTNPKHIVKWNSASDDWHTTKAENDLKVSGKFFSRMEAKDNSAGFDFEGTYTEVRPNEHISYTMSDGRKVKIDFINKKHKTKLTITFEAENENSIEMQKQGWQAILNNFKKYVEKNGND